MTEDAGRRRASGRIVLKAGTTTLTAGGSVLAPQRLDGLVGQITRLHKGGWEVVLVTSGAIVAGAARVGLARPPRAVPERQALAAIGQAILMHEYERRFAAAGIISAQVLLTAGDLADRRRYTHAQDAFRVLLREHAVPIVNENDTVAIEELSIGDNDTLAALVACMLDADLLCILSDVAGLYTGDPRRDAGARLIPVVEDVDAQIRRYARGAGSPQSVGGMITKLHAARIATAAGITVVITDGAEDDVLERVAHGEATGTVFRPARTPLPARRRWLAFAAKPRGTLVIDDGARTAVVEQSRSLLPAGIVRVEGTFDVGDLVTLVDASGASVAAGLASTSSAELRRIIAPRQSSTGVPVPRKVLREAVHRDNLVVLPQ